MAPQRTVVPHDEVVDALTPQGPDHAFDEGILPGIVAGSHATGAGDRRGDDPVDPPWLLTCAH